MASTATTSPKISAQAEKLLLEDTMREDCWWREETSWKNSEAVTGSKGM